MQLRNRLQPIAGIGTLVVVLGLIVGTAIYYFPTATNVGYAPEQPIPFSHKIHAGTNKMDCRYCHVNADRSQHATIPSMNICMNCHTVVRALDSPFIAKLKKHYDEGKPIEWVRVHELPDFVRFDHRPHVWKGISCQTCHGDVANMERMEQMSDLTMGWCLDCHRARNISPSIVSTIRGPAKPGTPGYKDVSEIRGDVDHGELAPNSCTTCHY